ncbi:synaptobrevin homolog YKT6-like [Sycon ciliatum]|uniref:synaptobrevin homolog YKT6-like n=1 Tax=Sycon ciliatum TaxID=27933 RepID=UPI0020AE4099|eukprot:scpid99390/ scgid33178/ Synaptobrevin homolog YKT6
MKLFGVQVFHKPSDTKANLQKGEYDLTSFGYFQRSKVQEFMVFTGQVLVERTHAGERKSVKEQEYLCHVYVRSDNTGAVLIADQEYPQRVAFTFLNKVLEQFVTDFPRRPLPSGEAQTYPVVAELLKKYQDPKQADSISKVQAELDETKIILYDTIESVLQRGEKLDDLVQKSEYLSYTSKTFYQEAKKTNSCCLIL